MKPRTQMSLTCFARGPTTSGADLALSLKIVNAGFVIEAEDNRVLTENQVREFYSQIAEQVRKFNKNPTVFSTFLSVLDPHYRKKQIRKCDQPNKLLPALFVCTPW